MISVWITHTYEIALPLRWLCVCGDKGRSKTWSTAIGAANRHTRKQHGANAEILE